MPINNIAEIADKFTRNEILTSNEIRQIIGFKPSDDPKADQLVNSNISQAKEDVDARYDTQTDTSAESSSLDDFWNTPISKLSGL